MRSLVPISWIVLLGVFYWLNPQNLWWLLIFFAAFMMSIAYWEKPKND